MGSGTTPASVKVSTPEAPQPGDAGPSPLPPPFSPLPSPRSLGRGERGEGRGRRREVLASPRTKSQFTNPALRRDSHVDLGDRAQERERSLAEIPSNQGETTMRKTLGSAITAGAVPRRGRFISLAPAVIPLGSSAPRAAISQRFRRNPETSRTSSPLSVPPPQHPQAERVPRRRSPCVCNPY